MTCVWSKTSFPCGGLFGLGLCDLRSCSAVVLDEVFLPAWYSLKRTLADKGERKIWYSSGNREPREGTKELAMKVREGLRKEEEYARQVWHLLNPSMNDGR